MSAIKVSQKEVKNQQYLKRRAFDICATKSEDGLVSDWRDALKSQQAQRLRLLESVVVNANHGVFITATTLVNQPSSRIVYVNKAFTQMTGYSPQEVLGRSPRLLQGSKTDQVVLQSLHTALQKQKPVELEIINYRKDGSQFWVELSVTPVADDEGNYTHFLAIQRDITERKQAEAASQQVNTDLERRVQELTVQLQQTRLDQAATAQVQELERFNRLNGQQEPPPAAALSKLNQLKDDFLSTVSHELRTPVTNMKMAIHMLQLAPDTQQQELYHQILRTECDRELELINDLLDLQQLEAMSYSSELSAVNLHEWLPEIIKPFQVRVLERQQSLRYGLFTSQSPILDHASLKRVLAELLNNACKYTSIGGEILFDARAQDDGTASTIFTVSNSAEIPVTELSHIFEKFYRVPNRNPWQQSGTGLGLALVQKIVKRLQGTIQVESCGGWTTFTLQLPHWKV